MSKDLIVAKLKAYNEYLLRWMGGEKSQRMLNFESELAALEKEPTAMEMIKEVFEPIQLGENEVVNQALELASKKAGKETAAYIKGYKKGLKEGYVNGLSVDKSGL